MNPLGHDTIVSLGTRLPPSLGVFGRLQGLLDDADTDLEDIVELVQIDPALTFQVIKLANSALYGLRSRCESLDEAVARVGFGDIHQIVGLAVARQSFQGELLVYDIAGGRLWENAVAAGTLNAALAEISGADARSAYATGLLRNVGKVVLNNYATQVRYPGEAVAPDVFAWEKRQHGYHAGEVAAVLLDHWRFAPDLVGTVCFHRHPEESPEFSAGAARLHLAAAWIAEWGCHLPGEATGWTRDEAMCERAGVPAECVADAVARARERFAKLSVINWTQAAA
jgi:HD-like signal output (HDOD) protein